MAFLLSPLKPTKPALNEKLVLTYHAASLLGADYALIMAGDEEYGRKLAEKAFTLSGPAAPRW
jgi:hypothetical protein